MNMSLQEKVVIITGASSGIGEAAAQLFASNGAQVVLGSRRSEHLEKVANEIKIKGGKAVSLAGDVTDESYAKSLVELARDEFGRVDGAFNNAGITGEMISITEMTSENWDTVIKTNLNSAFYAAKFQIPAMIESGGGSVVFTSSFVGYTVGLPGMAAYAASKAGLIGMSQVLATEHGSQGIRVNALLPGGTKTDMAGDDPQTLKWISELHALKRMAEPKEIAQSALFLISEQSSFVTGSALIADGGNSINKT